MVLAFAFSFGLQEATAIEASREEVVSSKEDGNGGYSCRTVAKVTSHKMPSLEGNIVAI